MQLYIHSQTSTVDFPWDMPYSIIAIYMPYICHIYAINIYIYIYIYVYIHIYICAYWPIVLSNRLRPIMKNDCPETVELCYALGPNRGAPQNSICSVTYILVWNYETQSNYKSVRYRASQVLWNIPYYRKVSNIRRAKSQNFNASRLIL